MVSSGLLVDRSDFRIYLADGGSIMALLINLSENRISCMVRPMMRTIYPLANEN